ncbi:hypothetical protein BJ741DRAFT_198773 [Chytriomyces cf. hyalinus JEL632]|nr:hypothetical protein BJ741DRAFT_198773 [Chytriomyces cf. hyalinus JEL632]
MRYRAFSSLAAPVLAGTHMHSIWAAWASKLAVQGNCVRRKSRIKIKQKKKKKKRKEIAGGVVAHLMICSHDCILHGFVRLGCVDTVLGVSQVAFASGHPSPRKLVCFDKTRTFSGIWFLSPPNAANFHTTFGLVPLHRHHDLYRS